MAASGGVVEFVLRLRDDASSALSAAATGAGTADAAVAELAQVIALAEQREKAHAAALGVSVSQLRQAEEAVRALVAEQQRAAVAADNAAKRAVEGGRAWGTAVPKAAGAAEAALEGVSRSGGKMGQVMQGLVPQVNDVVTSLSLGTPPMTVLAQQGGQIFQVFTQAGVSLAGFGAILGPVAIAAAALGAVYVTLNAELEKMDARNKAAAKSAQELSDVVNASRKSTADLNTEWMLATGQTTPQAVKMTKQLADEAKRAGEVERVLTSQIDEHRRALEALNKGGGGMQTSAGASQRASQKAALEAAIQAKEAALAGNAATREENELKIEAIKIAADQKEKEAALAKGRSAANKAQKQDLRELEAATRAFADQMEELGKQMRIAQDVRQWSDSMSRGLDATGGQLVALSNDANAAVSAAFSPASLAKSGASMALAGVFGTSLKSAFDAVAAFSDTKNSPLDQASAALAAFNAGLPNLGSELGQFISEGLLGFVRTLPSAAVGLVEGVVSALPDIAAGVVALLPMLVKEAILALARLAGDFWRAIFTSDGRKQIVDAIKEAFRAALGIKKEKDGLFAGIKAAFTGEDPAAAEDEDKRRERARNKRRYA